MADNSLYKNFEDNKGVPSFQGQPETIVDKPKSIADVMNNLGIRLKDETLLQIDNRQEGSSYTFKETSGKLRSTVRYTTDIFGETFATDLYLEDYYDFINKGVRGAESSERAPGSNYSYKKPASNETMPPYSALKEWSERRGLNVFAVRRSIWSKGIKQNGYFDKVVADAKNGEIHSLLIQDLKSAGQLGILQEIKKIIKQ